jgi:hypothetical protein
MNLYRAILSLCLSATLVLGSVGCSSTYTAPVATGGLAGAAAGAGTGAIIGAVISNGDIGASALLGTAIGLPVGLALGALYHYNSEYKVAERKGDIIRANQEEIFNRQRELDALREDLRNEGFQGNPPETDRHYYYNGNTLGNYYR